MERGFPGATVEASKDRTYSYALNDPDDGHVAHAAIIGEADAIVTDDSRAGFSTAPDLLQTRIKVMTARQVAQSLRPTRSG
jgi:predicted nucleic acid-binding protein